MTFVSYGGHQFFFFFLNLFIIKLLCLNVTSKDLFLSSNDPLCDPYHVILITFNTSEASQNQLFSGHPKILADILKL
jgi:hypothetical protein